MRKSKFSEEKIKKIIREYEDGTSVKTLAKKYSVTAPTIYRWREKYALNSVKQEKLKSKSYSNHHNQSQSTTDELIELRIENKILRELLQESLHKPTT